MLEKFLKSYCGYNGKNHRQAINRMLLMVAGLEQLGLITYEQQTAINRAIEA